MNTNPHEICILLGKMTGNNAGKNWNIKCTFCSVTYSEKERQENYFIKKFTCPCCKRKLKTFKTKQHNKKRISNN